ncbi:MAG: M28 family peptidase [Gemmatimonadota bacterium]|jgi:hypothetical protein|nr:M28 family peptidase [Gemmatimonadota bacterium]
MKRISSPWLVIGLMMTLAGVLALSSTPAAGQGFTTSDPVIRRIWEIGMNNSRAEEIAQVMLDSIGPRLTGSPAMDRAQRWAVGLIRSWGIDARNEQYGTWRGWDRGITHIDLIQPRVRTLEGTMMAMSPGTNSRPVEGPVTIVPEWQTEEELENWIRSTRGKFVALAFPQPTCRPDSHYSQYGSPGALDRLREEREVALQDFRIHVPSQNSLRLRVEAAGALGTLESSWSNDIGVNKIFSTNTSRMPSIDLSCEDYGLVWRLAANGQGPVVRLTAESRFTATVPVNNTIGEIRGRELPDEYVMLSAHFDSWDSASGATDNGTGSTVMLEALRILGEAYPNPRRTILIGLWGGEEQGLIGSRRYAAANPGVVEGMQALFNQDNGTGRIQSITGNGLVSSGAHLGDWLARVPDALKQGLTLELPGIPGSGGTDHSSFVCFGAPAFGLNAANWSYGIHTWHTNRDTFDKVVFEDVRINAVLTAMLVYLASEDTRIERELRVMPTSPNGQPGQWPICQPGQAAFE